MPNQAMSYETAALDALRARLLETSPDLAADARFTNPQFSTCSVMVQVDFGLESERSIRELAPGKPLQGDFHEEVAAEDSLRASFLDLEQRCLRSPPFDRSTGLFTRLQRAERDDLQLKANFLRACGPCVGKGQVKCKPCRGQGLVSCQRCDGRGEMGCSNCLSSGQVTDFSGAHVACPRCMGHKRTSCEQCSRRGRVRCTKCFGKKEVACKPCASTGSRRFAMEWRLFSTTHAILLPTTGPRPTEPATELLLAFGGIDRLEPAIGQPVESECKTGSVVYRLEVPCLGVTVATDSGSGRCLVAGEVPRVVVTGNFLEHTLNKKVEVLASLVQQSSPLMCDSVGLRSALLDCLSLPPHRACLAKEEARIPGVHGTYVARFNTLVGSALRLLKASSQIRYLTAGAITGPFAYIAAHRIFGLPPLEAASVGLVPLFIAYASAAASMRITLKSLSSNPADFEALRSVLQREAH